jgi:6-phosphogluconolactonase
MSGKGSRTAFAAAVVATTAAVGFAAYLFHKREVQKSRPTTLLYVDKAAVSKRLCAYVVQAAKKHIAEKGSFHLAVAGGSLIDALTGLVEHKNEIDFSKVVLSFVNHKCISPDDSSATVAKCKSKFATACGIQKIVCPSPSPKPDSNGDEEAKYYEEQLKAVVPVSKGYPVLDLVLLGLGADGHVGSCHPMGPAVANTTNVVAGSPKSGEPSSITMTIETINAAKEAVFVVCGGSDGKKEAVKRAMTRPAEKPRGTFPAQLIRGPIFFLDQAAATDL